MAWLTVVQRNVRSPKFDFVLPPNEPAFKRDDGRGFLIGCRFSGTILPNLTARQKDTKKLCDAFHIIGMICVSLKVRDIIESLEPNAHQFFPIALEAKDGTLHPVEYYIFNPCAVIDAYLDVADAPHWSERMVIGFPIGRALRTSRSARKKSRGGTFGWAVSKGEMIFSFLTFCTRSSRRRRFATSGVVIFLRRATLHGTLKNRCPR